MSSRDPFLQCHHELSRRFFLKIAGGAATTPFWYASTHAELPSDCAAACESFLAEMEYLTPQDEFGNVSRGDPRPYDLSDEEKQAVGLTPETWQLEVVSDSEHPADLENPLTKANGNAIDWSQLMKLAETRAVSFPKIMTCNNMGRPLGMGFWEGVPLRDVVWMTGPKQNLRRVYYSGFHNNDPKQIFRSSLPVGRVLEEPFDLPPVIICYKLNGQLLTGERGGPVRLVVPEAYGFKSVKWLNRIVLSNLYHANDTYAEQNNDVDSWLKTFARSLLKPEQIFPDRPIPVTGYAQVGISGLSKVQTLLLPKDEPLDESDPYFTKRNWTDAHILGAPTDWGGSLPENRPPTHLHGFDAATGRPQSWPMRLTMAHWATLLPGVPAGEYTLRCRSVDGRGIPQPMPRPFRKSGRNLIEEVALRVETT